MKFEDLTGKTFGRLTVIKRAENGKGGHTRWLCQCECGNKTISQAPDLKSGHTQSCGCLSKEKAAKTLTKHGKYGTRIYNIWWSMKARCNNPKNISYSRYGGRGIKVCDDWDTSFEKFEKWSLESGYDDSLSIDRIDNDGDYCPENCRWASRKEQSNNTRRNRYVEYNGELRTIAELSEEYGINYATLEKRLALGWSVETAVTTPAKERRACNE